MQHKRKNNLRLPFDPNGEIFRWGPVPGKFFYNSFFTEVHFKHFRKKYKENWSETFWLFKNGRMLWLNDSNQIQKAGQRVFLRYLLPAAKRSKIYAEWQSYVKSLNQLYKKIDALKLSTIPVSALLSLWNNLHKLYIKFWVTGSIPELANYGSVAFLEERLTVFIEKDGLRASALEALTTPERLSFYQEEEIDLAKTNNIDKHQREYYWLKNSYAGTEVLSVNFFKRRKADLANNLKKTITQKLKAASQRKIQIQAKYGLNKKIMDIAKAISTGVAWQDKRKKHILIAQHYMDVLAKEVARHFGYRFSDFSNLWYFEVAEIIKGKNLSKKIKNREKGFGVQFFHTCKELSAKQTDYVWQAYETKHTGKQTELKGIIASKGGGKKVKGRIRILLNPTKSHTFKEGEILAAPMTSPEYIFAMRKASAVLTDTGGLTSHAAIVTRELGIPCLVGTKLATKIFKDGDLVEVDANKGTAKKIT